MPPHAGAAFYRMPCAQHAVCVDCFRRGLASATSKMLEPPFRAWRQKINRTAMQTLHAWRMQLQEAEADAAALTCVTSAEGHECPAAVQYWRQRLARIRASTRGHPMKGNNYLFTLRCRLKARARLWCLRFAIKFCNMGLLSCPSLIRLSSAWRSKPKYKRFSCSTQTSQLLTQCHRHMKA